MLEESLNVRVVLMPDGEDPDSFAKSRNSDELESFIEENEQDFIHFKAQLLKKDAGTDPVGRVRVLLVRMAVSRRWMA